MKLPQSSRVFVVASVLAFGFAAGVVLDRDRDQQEIPVVDQGAYDAEDSGELLRFDASMFEVASVTGGDFYFWKPGEFAESDVRIPLGGDPILLAYGEFESASRTIEFPVGGLAGRLDIFVGAQRLNRVRVAHPFGYAISESEPDAEVQSFEHMRIFTIDRPQPGAWRIELEGAGAYSLSVHASLGTLPPVGDAALEPVELAGVHIVDVPEWHRGAEKYPLLRDVAPAEEVLIEATLEGSFSTASVLLIGMDGRVLDEAVVEAPEFDLDGYTARISGRCVVPDGPFRFLVQGFDAKGDSYQRVNAGAVVPRAGAAVESQDAESAPDALLRERDRPEYGK